MELEPVRRLGFALDQATLKQIALNNGIEESFTNMSQAEKAQLRYIALMTQIPQVQSDMARTIVSSANSIRVLNQQFTLLGREIGNIFIPLLNKIIPVAIAVVKVLGKVAKAIASLFGFQIPDLNWDGVKDVTGGVAEDLDDANGSAKKLKRQLAGFDELNNLTTPSAGKGSSANVVGPDFELPLPEYDMLEGLSKGIDDLTGQVMKFFGLTEDKGGKLSWSWKDMDSNAKILTATIGTLAGAKVIGKLGTAFGTIKTVGSAIAKTGIGKYFLDLWTAIKWIGQDAGVATQLIYDHLQVGLKFLGAIGGVASSIKGIKDMNKAFKGLVNETMTYEEANKKATKSVMELTIGGAAIGSVFGPLGTIIGGAVGALAAGVVAQINYNKALKEFAKMQIYGEFELTQQQLETLGQKLTGTLNQEQQAVETYKKSLQDSASQLQSTTNDFDSLIFRFQTLGSELSGLTGEDVINGFKNTATEAYNIVGNTTDATIELFRKQFAEYSNLSAEEQAEIIKNIKTNGNTRQTRIKEIEDEVQRIYEKAIAERGYLNEQEIEAIKKHYDEIVRLTSSNLERNGLELNRILSNVQNGMFALTEDGAKQLNETLSKSNEEALGLIDENYKARLESAQTYAQTQYDNAILAGENEVEAQDRYNKALNLLEAEANNYKIEETNKLNAKYSTIMNSFYGQAIRDYKENYIGKTEKELGDHGVAVKKAYEKMLTDAGFNLAEIARTSTTQSILATNNWNNNFKPNTSISSIALDTNGITRSGINAGNIWSSGFNSVVSGLSINTKVNSGYTAFGDAVQFQLKMGGFASGGFPDTGEFFMARENGIPEMVGKIGNRTAVANNTQIVEAIEQGVYRGTASANESASATPIYNVVNIGNRKVYSGVAQNVRTENNRYGVAVLEV